MFTLFNCVELLNWNCFVYEVTKLVQRIFSKKFEHAICEFIRHKHDLFEYMFFVSQQGEERTIYAYRFTQFSGSVFLLNWEFQAEIILLFSVLISGTIKDKIYS